MDRDVDPAEIEGVHLWEEFADAVGTPFYERYHEVLETQTPATFEEYYDPLDTWFEVSAYPSDNGLSIYFRDVTEKHRQRERLKEQDRVLRSMYEIISDRDRSFSMQVQDLLALGREVLGTKYSSFSHIRGDTYVFEAVDAADDSLQTGDAVPLSHTHCEVAADTEKTLVLGDVARDAPEQTERVGYTEWGISCYLGAPVFVEDEVYGTFCFYDEEARSDQFSDWHVTLVDLMSRWIGYELQRQRTNERLRDQNDKLERFTSIVSHDIRNLLNVARGQLDLAKEACDSDHLDEIKRSHDRIESLVDGLLGLARAGDVIDHQETVALDRAVERWLEGVPTESASLRVDSGRRIEADEDRLQQLFENLIRNAVEHGGSDVTVTVGDVDGGFYVADDGPGIPPAERDNVLESGYSTADDGNGLGLAIVREIAEAHGWNVRVTGSQDSDVSDGPAESNGERDRPSGGARFEFTGVVDTE
jgi:signal transduction histidine kinase